MAHVVFNLELIKEFCDLDEKELKKYGVDEGEWIPEDFWAGFVAAIDGLVNFLKEGDEGEDS